MVKKSFKLVLSNKIQDFGFKFLLMLILLKQELFFKESNGKKNLVFSLSTSDSKIIFVLQDKVIAVNIELIFIYIRNSVFE